MANPLFSFDPTEVLLRLADGVIVCDPQRIVHFANPRAAQHLGVDADRLLGQPVDLLFASRNIPLPHLGGSVTYSNALEISARPLPMTVAAYPREGTLYMISDRPADIATQRDFLVALAHQLRTPLTVIRGMSELLIRRLVGPLDGDQDELIGVIAARAIDLSSLVNNLIAMANLDAGHVRDEPGWIDLRERLDTSLAYLVSSRHLPQHEPRYLIAPEAAQVRIDPDMLRHILEGLLSHALVVTPGDGVISVCATRAGDYFELEVNDSGPPVPAYQRRRIFERWAYIPRTPEGISRGSGLEIALARMFVERCGGAISYEPYAGEGNRWVVRLPQPAQRS
jgi:signal transduction histidine kinase